MNAGAFILEIARSEIAYTDQRPAEYVAVMLAAALREGFRGPVFIQGDHFQVNAKKFAVDPQTEVDGVKALVREAIAAGFYNIDIDTSTLVDLSKPTLDEQQRLNYEVGIDILKTVRQLAAAGRHDLRRRRDRRGRHGEQHRRGAPRVHGRLQSQALPAGMAGLSKISVQSGTSHGGVVLADGSIADVKLDLDTLERLSKVARDEYGWPARCSTARRRCPIRAFHNFPKRETAEIHLATNFQNMLYDHMPAALRAEIYDWLKANAKDERKATDTDEQFFYKTRKKALGPFKQQLWDLPRATQGASGQGVRREVHLPVQAAGDRRYGARPSLSLSKRPRIHRLDPSESLAVAAAPDDADLSD